MTYEATINAQRLAVQAALNIGLPTTAGVGDSLMLAADAGGGASTYKQAIYRGRGKIRDLGLFAVAGKRTDEIAAQIPGALATGAKRIPLNGGVNDILQNIPIATIKANLVANLLAVIAGGASPIDIGNPPTNTPAAVANYVRLNLYRKLWCFKNVIQHADIWPLLATAAGAYQSGRFLDVTHYNLAGAAPCGDLLASMLTNAPIFPPALLAYADVATDHDSYLNNDVSWGTVGATALPTGWGAVGSGGAYIVNAADAGDFGNWMCCTVSAGSLVGMTATAASLASLSWTAGDKLAVGFNIRIGGAASALAIRAYPQSGNYVPYWFDIFGAGDAQTMTVYGEVIASASAVQMGFVGTGTGYFEVQRPMVVNLTKLGLA